VTRDGDLAGQERISGVLVRDDENVLTRSGSLLEVFVVVPPGVWHGLRNETGAPAAFLNYFDTPYSHEDPDNWRFPHDSVNPPCPL
jgi:dTDP-4-dehydrorhamnose 3,5-epimerase